MKRITLYLLLICFVNSHLSFSQQRECITANASSASKSLKNKYMKNVYKPLLNGSASFSYGRIEFTETLHYKSNPTPYVKHCIMDFVKIPNSGSVLPFICLTVNEDSVQYVSNRDSLYIINHKNKTVMIKDFKETYQFLMNNPFLSFYAYWIAMYGPVQEDFTLTYSKDTVFSAFTVPQLMDGDKPRNQSGYYQYIYHKKNKLLFQELYQPCDEWAEKLNFVKREYRLLSFKPIFSIAQVFDMIDFNGFKIIYNK